MDFLSGETANSRMRKERLARCQAQYWAQKRTGATWADKP